MLFELNLSLSLDCMVVLIVIKVKLVLIAIKIKTVRPKFQRSTQLRRSFRCITPRFIWGKRGTANCAVPELQRSSPAESREHVSMLENSYRSSGSLFSYPLPDESGGYAQITPLEYQGYNNSERDYRLFSIAFPISNRFYYKRLSPGFVSTALLIQLSVINVRRNPF